VDDPAHCTRPSRSTPLMRCRPAALLMLSSSVHIPVGPIASICEIGRPCSALLSKRQCFRGPMSTCLPPIRLPPPPPPAGPQPAGCFMHSPLHGDHGLILGPCSALQSPLANKTATAPLALGRSSRSLPRYAFPPLE